MRKRWLDFRRTYYADDEPAYAIYSGVAWFVVVVWWCALVALYLAQRSV